MAVRDVLRDWLVEALESLGGSGSVLEVSQEVWRLHQREIESTGDLLYSWQ